jgi:hypothetical protein
VIAFSVSVFLVNLVLSIMRGEKSGSDPWDARTLEWSLPSPVPHYNFKEIPQVHSLDDFWHRKYTEDEAGRPIPIVAGAAVDDEEHDGHGIHMPSPSYFPLIASSGFPVIATGLIYHRPCRSALLAAGGLYGWAMEAAARKRLRWTTPSFPDTGKHQQLTTGSSSCGFGSVPLLRLLMRLLLYRDRVCKGFPGDCSTSRSLR